MSNGFVICMGMGTVFVGLICLVLLCKIVSFICRATERKTPAPAAASAPAAAPEIENRQELIAAVSAAVAEDMGTDISAIRITSFKKL